MSELKSYKNLECAFSTSSQQDIVVAEDSEGGYALRIGFRFASVEACMKYAPKHGLEVIGIA